MQTVADAARDVAQDKFWLERRYGFDNLVTGKVFARAEAWRSRPETASGPPHYDYGTTTARLTPPTLPPAGATNDPRCPFRAAFAECTAPVLTTRALPDSQFEGHAELQGVYGLYVHVLALTL